MTGPSPSVSASSALSADSAYSTVSTLRIAMALERVAPGPLMQPPVQERNSRKSGSFSSLTVSPDSVSLIASMPETDIILTDWSVSYFLQAAIIPPSTGNSSAFAARRGINGYCFPMSAGMVSECTGAVIFSVSNQARNSLNVRAASISSHTSASRFFAIQGPMNTTPISFPYSFRRYRA